MDTVQAFLCGPFGTLQEFSRGSFSKCGSFSICSETLVAVTLSGMWILGNRVLICLILYSQNLVHKLLLECLMK